MRFSGIPLFIEYDEAPSFCKSRGHSFRMSSRHSVSFAPSLISLWQPLLCGLSIEPGTAITSRPISAAKPHGNQRTGFQGGLDHQRYLRQCGNQAVAARKVACKRTRVQRELADNQSPFGNFISKVFIGRRINAVYARPPHGDGAALLPATRPDGRRCRCPKPYPTRRECLSHPTPCRNLWQSASPAAWHGGCRRWRRKRLCSSRTLPRKNKTAWRGQPCVSISGKSSS